MAEQLQVVDCRTGNSYKIPIDGGYIRAADLGRIGISESFNENGDVNAPKILRPLKILDNGYQHTACMESSITFIDGQRGLIRYRDHTIENLFHDYVYEDVMYLIIWGHLPSAEQKSHIREEISKAMTPPETVVKVISAFPRDAESFPMLIAGMSAFAASDEVMCATRHQQAAMFQGHLDVADKALLRTIAYMASTIALIYCHQNDKEFTPPEIGTSHSLCGNLLRMMGVTNPKVEACLNKLWILYADHEMTNSTAAVLHAGSTLIDPLSAATAGVICGYGPLHGGAIDLAYEGFKQIGTPERVPVFMELIKAKHGRLFGYGHRVYKTRDPRINLIEELLEEHRAAVDANPLLRVAMEIDKFANQDQYFIDRGLKANADLLGCFLYTAMGFDPQMIIAITILSRAPGALAHWRESLMQPVKLWRPQQKYVPPMAN
ncbi:Uu.00g125910.m01.CDS01 [Anthostomella pinea]|uniref:Citrate synthase n=1 Tax=Anthostomella pinea TaxID=933095 RepID=A0AAI8VCK1_9PEZI|nr:Uu.00g125910.m01.CDS01 [Anthostomella pinea]